MQRTAKQAARREGKNGNQRAYREMGHIIRHMPWFGEAYKRHVNDSSGAAAKKHLMAICEERGFDIAFDVKQRSYPLGFVLTPTAENAHRANEIREELIRAVRTEEKGVRRYSIPQIQQSVQAFEQPTNPPAQAPAPKMASVLQQPVSNATRDFQANVMAAAPVPSASGLGIDLRPYQAVHNTQNASEMAMGHTFSAAGAGMAGHLLVMEPPFAPVGPPAYQANAFPAPDEPQLTMEFLDFIENMDLRPRQ